MSLITVIGSLNYDITTYVKVIPAANETKHAEDVQYNLGGKGFNQCIGLSKSREKKELEIRMIGSVGGKDNYGELFLKNLKENNVITDNILTFEQNATGLANIIVESDKNYANRIMVFPGANAETKFNKEQLSSLFENKSSEFIVLQNEIPEPLAIIDFLTLSEKKLNSKFIIYNPSPFNAVKYNDEKMWSKINVLIFNEIEIFQLAQTLNVFSETETAPKDNDKEFVEFFTNLTIPVAKAINYPIKKLNRLSGIIIITLGAHGYIYYNHYTSALIFKPASQLIAKPIDSTGCGDTFLGYLTTTLAESLDPDSDLDTTLLHALKIANIAAGIAVTRTGASSSVPYRDEVRTLFNV
ncbi:hypothetical protein QEN19_002871 [Hanseniaspora menglaensis]